MATLYNLPRDVVKTIMDNHVEAQLAAPAFSRLWHHAQTVIDVCSAILRSPKDDETGN
jgi:hypothetical protein